MVGKRECQARMLKITISVAFGQNGKKLERGLAVQKKKGKEK